MFNRLIKLGQFVVPYAPKGQKRVTHSTIKVLHQPTSSECVTTFPCSLPRVCPNDNECKAAIVCNGHIRLILTKLPNNMCSGYFSYPLGKLFCCFY